MFAADIFGSRNMSSQTANARHYFLDAFAGKRTRENNSPRKEQGFPEYIVDVTRNSLLSFTTSLTKISSQAHDFFARISAAFAFERMMHTCMGWFMPGLAAPSPMCAMGMDTITMVPMGLAMSQMWGMPDMHTPIPQYATKQPSKWFGVSFPTLPKPEPKPTPAPRASFADLPVYGAFFALPAAFFAIAPSLMQVWNLAG